MTNPFISKRQNLEDLQIQVQQLLDELAENDIGAGFQVSAYWHGELVLNAFSGSTDSAGRRSVASDTLFVVQSCSKGIISTAIHILVQQGKLAYDERISHYWPEFGANGKENITLRQVLTHTAGVPLMPTYADMRLITDWRAMVCEMEKLEPIWEPGSKSGYHGLTFGWILGETASRADGRTIAQIVHDEICKPLGIEKDLYLGASSEAESRIAEISGEAVPIASMPNDMLFKRVLPPALVPVANPEWNTPWFHTAAVPAVNVVATAQALACMYASLIDEGVNGKRLLEPTSIAEATSLHFEGIDEVALAPIRLGLGYSLSQEGDVMGGNPMAFGYAGLGGMIGYADPSNCLAVAVLCNRMKVGRGKRSPDRLVTDLIREKLSNAKS